MPTPTSTMAAKQDDVPVEYKPEGYHRLARLMGPYTETAIFRRFGDLNMLSLMYMQAEIIELESRFGYTCRRDTLGAPPASATSKEYAFDLKALRESESEIYHDQLDQLKIIQKKLKEYNSALIQASEVARIGRPRPENLRFLREWLAGKEEGNNFLKAAEARTWEPKNDLVSLHLELSDDTPMMPWLSNGLFGLIHTVLRGCWARRRVPDEESGIIVYPDAHLNRLNKLLVTVLASLLPVVAIIVLNTMHGTWPRIYAMSGFTAAFAVALAAFTSARRLEIFASTAAFAAVEVVFIGSVAS